MSRVEQARLIPQVLAAHPHLASLALSVELVSVKPLLDKSGRLAERRTRPPREDDATPGALIGLGIDGEEGMKAGAAAGAEATADGVEFYNAEEECNVLVEIPNDSAAALILIVHHWAVPLRDAIARAGGFRISDGFISPLDVAIGLITAEEAREHHTLEKTHRRRSQLRRKEELRCSEHAESRGAHQGASPAAARQAIDHLGVWVEALRRCLHPHSFPPSEAGVEREARRPLHPDR